MSHISSNTEKPFKGSNCPNMGLSWCKGIMTLKSDEPNSHEEKLSKLSFTIMYNRNAKNMEKNQQMSNKKRKIK